VGACSRRYSLFKNERHVALCSALFKWRARARAEKLYASVAMIRNLLRLQSLSVTSRRHLPTIAQAHVDPVLVKKLVFWLNGVRQEVERIEPDMFLIDYIRARGLTGTKLACGEVRRCFFGRECRR
jgi:hypothetical protein